MNILTHSCFLLTKVRTYSSKKRTSMTFLWILYHFLSVPGMEGLRILILCTSAEFFRWSSLTWFDNYFDYLIWKLAKILWGKVFSYISGGLKLYGGGGRVAGGGGILLFFYYFISLETANTQKGEVFLLRISSGNVNTSGVVTCWYLPIYWKNPWEKLHFLC